MPVTMLYLRQRHVPRRVQAFMGGMEALLTDQLDPALSGAR